jgi:hypothetical protein
MLATLALLSVNLAALPAGDPVSMSTSCASCRLFGSVLAQAPADREEELTRRISDLNWQIRSINTDWPAGSLIAAYLGYVLAPFLLPGAVFVPVGLAVGSAAGPLLAIGIACLVVGGVGGVLLAIGVIGGLDASAAAKEEKLRLTQERDGLETELRALRRGHRGELDAPPVMLTLAAF